MPKLYKCRCDDEGKIDPDCGCVWCEANRRILAARDEALEEAAKQCDEYREWWQRSSGRHDAGRALGDAIRAMRSPQPRPPLDPDDCEAGIGPEHC